MKIVYCLKSTFNSGGMERIVIAKANHFAQLGNEVWIVTTDQNGRNPFFYVDKTINTSDLSINYDDIEHLPFFQKLISRQVKISHHKKELQAFVNKLNPDIIISTFGNEISFLHKLKTQAKKIAEIHFSGNYRLRLNQKGLRRIANRWLTYKFKQNVKHYDAFVCLTEEDKHNWKGIKNLSVIPNFIDSKSEHPAILKNKSVISVGRLNYQKGYDRLVKAWKYVSEQYPDWTLQIYGSGELKQELENQIQMSGLSSVISINSPTNDIYARLMASSVYVLSSRYEGLPMVLIEAMACGLPIVSYDCECGPKDLLSNNDAGILVPEGDINGLAKAIISLISDDNRRLSMGASSYKEADNYLCTNIIDRWISLFDSLINS